MKCGEILNIVNCTNVRYKLHVGLFMISKSIPRKRKIKICRLMSLFQK